MELGLSGGQRSGSCGFCKDEAISTVKEADQAAAGIETEGAELGKSCQGFIVGGFDSMGRQRARCLEGCEGRELGGIFLGRLGAVVIARKLFSSWSGTGADDLPVELALLGPISIVVHIGARFALLRSCRRRDAVGHGDYGQHTVGSLWRRMGMLRQTGGRR